MAEPIAAREPPRHHRLELLDILRFAAALMVVSFHWLFNGMHNGKVTSVEQSPVLADIAVYGYFGVHLFFLISGFVISQSALGKPAGVFARTRAVRLYPAYWVAVTITTLIGLVIGGTVMSPTIKQYLANLTMAPDLFGQEPIDGVYWTLTVELSFYVLVLGILFFGLGRFLEQIFPLWALAMLVVAIVAPTHADLPFAGGYYAFFASGAIIATIQRRGFSILQLIGLTAGLATALMFVARQVPKFNDQRDTALTVPGVVIMVLIFFALVASMWIPRVASLRIPLSRQISDLTYPIYLLHAHIGYMVLNQFATEQNKWVVYAFMLAGLLGGAWLLHWGVEVKLAGAWRRFFKLVLERPIESVRRVTRLSDFENQVNSARLPWQGRPTVYKVLG